LHFAWPHPEHPGEVLPRRYLKLSVDTAVCYWTTGGGTDFADALAGLMEANEEQVADLYRCIWKGRATEVDDPSAFYALVLSGAQGRATVQDWIETTVASAQQNLTRHFEDIRIVRNCPPSKTQAWPPAVPLPSLLEAVAVHGKRENVPTALATKLVEAVLKGQPYPLSLLQRALVRARAEMGANDWLAMARRDARAALIKGVLRRTFGLEIGESMNANAAQGEQGYLFGRLMALIERMQQVALGDVNATVVDRFFSAASATPKAVFPRVMKNCRYHATKAKGDPRSQGTARWLERQLDEVSQQIKEFPSHLDLQQQGLFILGYHHQRYALWQKRPPAEEKTTAEAETVTTRD
jgi:CRISPR-associated protein Csd1